MSRARRRCEASSGAVASVLGGAVSREQLAAAAAREGQDGSRLVRTLIRRYLPSRAELARVYACRNAPPRVGSRGLEPAPQTNRLLDCNLLRQARCVPLLLLDEVCVLAVESGREAEAVAAVHAALRRSVVPVLADGPAIEDAIRRVPAPAAAEPRPLHARGPSPTWGRFEAQVIRGAVLPGIEPDAPAS
ncbi:MAG: hypothetical protein ACE5JG_08080 [Planctomycetota bacterium]